jgi:ketosteroid isomerase-like protein
VSQESIQLVRDMYSAFHAGDFERALSYFHEDAVVDATARVDGGTGRGRGELGRIIGQWLAMFDDWHEEIEEITGSGDSVCVIAIQSGRGKDSGIETRSRYAVLYEVRDGAITGMKLYLDPDEALKDAGLESG